MKYELILSGFPEADLNRRVLAHDLCRMKKHIKEIDGKIMDELDTYFETICVMAKMDADIFKGFFRRIARGRK